MRCWTLSLALLLVGQVSRVLALGTGEARFAGEAIAHALLAGSSIQRSISWIPWVVASRALGFTGEGMSQQRAIGALGAELLRLALQAITCAWLTCPSSLSSPNSIESRGAHLFTTHLRCEKCAALAGCTPGG